MMKCIIITMVVPLPNNQNLATTTNTFQTTKQANHQTTKPPKPKFAANHQHQKRQTTKPPNPQNHQNHQQQQINTAQYQCISTSILPCAYNCCSHKDSKEMSKHCKLNRHHKLQTHFQIPHLSLTHSALYQQCASAAIQSAHSQAA